MKNLHLTPALIASLLIAGCQSTGYQMTRCPKCAQMHQAVAYQPPRVLPMDWFGRVSTASFRDSRQADPTDPAIPPSPSYSESTGVSELPPLPADRIPELLLNSTVPSTNANQ